MVLRDGRLQPERRGAHVVQELPPGSPPPDGGTHAGGSDDRGPARGRQRRRRAARRRHDVPQQFGPGVRDRRRRAGRGPAFPGRQCPSCGRDRGCPRPIHRGRGHRRGDEPEHPGGSHRQRSRLHRSGPQPLGPGHHGGRGGVDTGGLGHHRRGGRGAADPVARPACPGPRRSSRLCGRQCHGVPVHRLGPPDRPRL